MPKTGKTQYYKHIVGGKPYYEAHAWAGNIPYGYTSVSREEFAGKGMDVMESYKDPRYTKMIGEARAGTGKYAPEYTQPEKPKPDISGMVNIGTHEKPMYVPSGSPAHKLETSGKYRPIVAGVQQAGEDIKKLSGEMKEGKQVNIGTPEAPLTVPEGSAAHLNWQKQQGTGVGTGAGVGAGAGIGAETSTGALKNGDYTGIRPDLIPFIESGRLSEDDALMISLLQPGENEADKKYRENQEASLQRIIDLETELLKTKDVDSPELVELRQQREELQQTIADITPKQFLETQPGLKGVGITQAYLERQTAATRDPLISQLSKMLYSESKLSQIEAKEEEGIARELEAARLQFGLRAEIEGLRPGAPDTDLLQQFLFKEPEKEKEYAPPTSVKEYEYAVEQGYKGTFEEWKKKAEETGMGYKTTTIGGLLGLDETTAKRFDEDLEQEIKAVYSGKYGTEGSRERALNNLAAKYPGLGKDVIGEIVYGSERFNAAFPDGYESDIQTKKTTNSGGISNEDLAD